MARHMTVEDCKSGRDFAHLVNNNPLAHDIRQSGSHLCCKGPKPGTAVIPIHGGDMPTGTRKSVIKMLMLIGLAIFLLSCLAMAMLGA